MDTPQEKGDSLENAVAAIEEVILRSSGMGAKPIVEKKENHSKRRPPRNRRLRHCEFGTRV